MMWQNDSYGTNPADGTVFGRVDRDQWVTTIPDAPFFVPGESTFFIPDLATNSGDESTWASWSEVESNLRAPDQNGDEPLGETDSLDLSWADAVSPSGTRRIFRSTAGESFVLDEYGGLVVKMTEPIAWTVVNDSGVAAGIKTLNAAVLPGEPAQMFPRLLLSTGQEFDLALPPGSSDHPTLVSLSNDGKALIYTSLINSQWYSSSAYFLFDTATSTLSRVRQPGLGDEFIVNLSITTGRLLGNGTKLFQITPDGTCIRLEALRIKNSPTDQQVPFGTLYPEAYPGALTPIHISSNGTITLSSMDNENRTDILQIIPHNDADGDGMNDDWEKSFASRLLALGNPPEYWGSNFQALTSGNLNPEIDYSGDGITAQEISDYLKVPSEISSDGIHLEQEYKCNYLYWAEYTPPRNGHAAVFDGTYFSSNLGFGGERFEISETSQFQPQSIVSRTNQNSWSNRRDSSPWFIDSTGFLYGSGYSHYYTYEAGSKSIYRSIYQVTRYRLVRTELSNAPIMCQYLKIFKHAIYPGLLGVPVVDEVEPVTLTIPADRLTSNWVECTPQISSGLQRSVSLLPVEVRGYVTGERVADAPGAKYRHLSPDPADYTGSKTAPKTELKIVQWGDNYIFDPGKNHAFDDAKFKQDVDIFRIRLPDIDPPAGTAEHRIKIWTVDAAGAEVDEGAEVDLNVFDNFHETAALGLVADDETDDTFAVEGKADGALGDRTYRAKLGGKLKFQWITCPGTGEKPIFEIPIPIKRIVTAKGFLLTGTTGAATATYWFDRTKKIYSAIGVDLQYSLQTIDPLPAGVDLAGVGFDIPNEITGYLQEMRPETKALMDDPRCQVTPGTIPVFFVNKLNPAAQGVANTPSYMAPGDEKYAGAIFMNSNHQQESALAHEFAHVLLDAQHSPSSNALWNDEYLRIKTNIWFGNQGMAGINSWSEIGISAHRRLTDTMRSRIWNSPYAKNP